MTFEELEKNLKTGKLESLYLLYGEEQYLLEQSIKKIKKNFGELVNGINYIQIDEKNVNNLISDIETPAFGYSKKLIIVKNSGLFKKETRTKKKEEKTAKKNQANKSLVEKISTYIAENIKTINEFAILVFIEQEIGTNELVKTIQKLGIVCNFEELKPNQIASRIKSICTAYKVNISNVDINYFIEECGTNMQELINEIRKLIEYAGENGTIKKEIVRRQSELSRQNVYFT